MARLIDADSVTLDKRMYDEMAIGMPMEERYRLLLKYQPTVEAIPIEWIKNKIAVSVHLWEEGKDKMFIENGVAEIVSYSLTAQALSQLLEWWEKENE